MFNTPPTKYLAGKRPSPLGLVYICILQSKLLQLSLKLYLLDKFCFNPLSYGGGRCTPLCFFALYSKNLQATHT